MISGRAPLGPFFEFDATGELDAPWEDAAVAVLHGGRSSAAQGHLYAHMLDHRLVVQVGGLDRRLSILSADLASTARPEATQSLLVAGADVVAWRKSGAALRGEMLDDSLQAPAALPTAFIVSYRHYEVSTRTTPEFASLIDLAPRGSVDELSQSLSLASPRGRFGVTLRAGLGRDADRGARTTMAGGSLVWAPTAALRVALAYEESTDDLTTGLTGRRQAGTVSLHADF